MASSEQSSVSRETFWWELRSVPDALRSNDLLHQEIESRLDEYYRGWQSRLASLIAYADKVTVAFRICAQSDNARVRLLIGISFSNFESATRPKVVVAESIVHSLFSRGCHRWLSQVSHEDFLKLCPPPEQSGAVVHICQWFDSHKWMNAESRVEQQRKSRILSLRPMAGPAGSLVGILENLVGIRKALQDSKTEKSKSNVLCFTTYLHPTVVSEEELHWLGQMALDLEQHDASGRRGDGTESNVLVDSSRKKEAANVRAFLHTLEPAFTSVSEVVVITKNFEESRRHAVSFANAVAAVYQSSQQLREMEFADETVNGRWFIAEPIGLAQNVARARSHDANWAKGVGQKSLEFAMDAYLNLSIRHWIMWARDMRDYPVRIPYLTSTKGASTVFRLPLDLGNGLPGIPLRQIAPDFDPGFDPGVLEESPSRDDLIDYKASKVKTIDKVETIKLGTLESNVTLRFPLDDLTRHVLIVGNTGSGKTVTTQNLLRELPKDIPFLVLETAKKEYRRLAAIDTGDPLQNGVKAYSPGCEGVVPVRINPFQLLPGTRVESHIGALQSCFEASMPIDGPLFAILEEGLVQSYQRLGWRIEDTIETRSKNGLLIFPTMTLFSLIVREIAKKRGYKGDVQSNVEAAISGRLAPMTLASGTSKGHLLDCYESFPLLGELFENRTVIELNDLRAEDKSFITMLYLVFLREYRQAPQREYKDEAKKDKAAQVNVPDRKLKHLTVVEEAHNVLCAPGTGEAGSTPQTRQAAIERFSNMLTEMRSLGQSFVIADQSPHKILADAIRNTNLQIVHQLRATDDREAVAASMVMSPEQASFVAKLQRGWAAVFFSGLERATFIKVPDPPPAVDLSDVTDEQLRDSMCTKEPNNGLLWPVERKWPFRGCIKCPERGTCPERDPANVMFNFANKFVNRACKDRRIHEKVLDLSANATDSQKTFSLALKLLNDFRREKQRRRPLTGARRWCSWLHLLEKIRGLTSMKSTDSQTATLIWLEQAELEVASSSWAFKE